MRMGVENSLTSPQREGEEEGWFPVGEGECPEDELKPEKQDHQEPRQPLAQNVRPFND